MECFVRSTWYVLYDDKLHVRQLKMRREKVECELLTPQREVS